MRSGMVSLLVTMTRVLLSEKISAICSSLSCEASVIIWLPSQTATMSYWLSI